MKKRFAQRIIIVAMYNGKWLRPLILAALLAAIFLPAPVSGYSALRRAEADLQAGHHASALQHYEDAARLLFWRTDLWERAGLAAFSAKDFPRAVMFLTRAPELSEQGWAALGYSHLSMDDFPSALRDYQRGLQFYDSSSLYAGLAYIHREQKEWDAERIALANQVRLRAGDAYTYYRLGVLLCLFEPEQAYDKLTLASSLNPEVDPAVQTLRSALNLSSTQHDKSAQMITMGRALGLVQEWELAFAAFEQAIASDPENAEAWAWLGEAKQQLGRDGRVELDRALFFDRTSVVVRGLRALYWERQERFAQMLAEYLLAAEYEPNNPAWRAGIGSAYAKRGDLNAALTAFQRAVELSPNDATYWRLLAVFCAENNAHVEEIGLPAALEAVRLAPENPSALDALGLAYFSSGRFANAEQTFLKALEIDPEHFPAHIHLAMNHLAQGNRTAAFNVLTFVRDADVSGVYREAALQLLERHFP